MKDQKRNESVELTLSIEHSEPEAMSSALVTEADFSCSSQQITVSIETESFNDARARWNSLMRALIASEHSLEATRRGLGHE